MPSRGYRKGMSDRKIPLTARINTRVPLDVATYLTHQAHLRSITRAKLTREMLTAEARQLRLELPQPRVNKDTHRVMAGAATTSSSWSARPACSACTCWNTIPNACSPSFSP